MPITPETFRRYILDIIAGIFLLVTSILIHTDKLSILRDPMYAGILSIIFLGISAERILAEKSIKGLVSTLNGLLIGVGLLFVSLLIYHQQWMIIRHYILPLSIGLLLLFFTTLDFTATSILHRSRVDLCGIIGGEALILYSYLLYIKELYIAWNPLYPAALGTTLLTVIMVDWVNTAYSIEYQDLQKTMQDFNGRIITMRSELQTLQAKAKSSTPVQPRIQDYTSDKNIKPLPKPIDIKKIQKLVGSGDEITQEDGTQNEFRELVKNAIALKESLDRQRKTPSQ